MRSLVVIELLEPVVEWNREGLIPWANNWLADTRVELLQEDFFRYLDRPANPDSRFDLILIDIDDGPEHVWDKSHLPFYSRDGLLAASSHLGGSGMLGLWFAVRPSEAFLTMVGAIFQEARIESVQFHNPALDQQEEHFLVLAKRGERTK